MLLADHAPHELLGDIDVLRPLLLGAVIVFVLTLATADRAFSVAVRVLLGAAVAVAAMFPATLFGYCSQIRPEIGLVIFAGPVVYALAGRVRRGRSARLGFWAIAGVAGTVYAITAASSCWDDSYAHGEGPAYPVLLAAPLAVLGLAAQPGIRQFVTPGFHHAAAAVFEPANSTAMPVAPVETPPPPPAPPPPLPLPRTLADARLLRLLLVPCIGVAAVMTLTVLLAPAGIPLGTLAIAIFVVAGRVTKCQQPWPKHGLALLGVSIVVAVLANGWMIIWAIQQEFTFSSDGSGVAIAVALAWSSALVTLSVRTMRTSRTAVASAQVVSQPGRGPSPPEG